MKVDLRKDLNAKLIVKKCHICGHIMESAIEMQKCGKCKKSFLPTNYFSKVHAKSVKEYEQLFAQCHEMHEEDLVKGLNVLW